MNVGEWMVEKLMENTDLCPASPPTHKPSPMTLWVLHMVLLTLLAWPMCMHLLCLTSQSPANTDRPASCVVSADRMAFSSLLSATKFL